MHKKFKQAATWGLVGILSLSNTATPIIAIAADSTNTIVNENTIDNSEERKNLDDFVVTFTSNRNVLNDEVPKFGTDSFWIWFENLQAMEDSTTAEETLLSWYKTEKEKKASSSNASYSSDELEKFIMNELDKKNYDAILDAITSSDIDFLDVIMYIAYCDPRVQEAGITTYSSSLGSLWNGWTVDWSFLSSSDGSESNPYRITTASQLMTVSELAAMGMVDLDSHDLSGKYFRLENSIDLGGMNWNPIGWYDGNTASGTPNSFNGHFDGNNCTISNFKINTTGDYCGLFGSIENSSIENLTVKPKSSFTTGDKAGIIVGYSDNSEIKKCSVDGTIISTGNAGGIAGHIVDTVIEDCSAAISINSQTSNSNDGVGGIVGTATTSTVVDVNVKAGTTDANRLQGTCNIGGIVGVLNNSYLMNSFLESGIVGGSGSTSIGGLVGFYDTGVVKVGRFGGSLGQASLGVNTHTGCFIGNRTEGNTYSYVEDGNGNIGYLYTNASEKLQTGVIGSGLTSDNAYTDAAHIGVWDATTNFFKLYSGANYTYDSSYDGIYFYDELEDGILSAIDYNIPNDTLNDKYEINHISVDKNGKPVEGRLVSIVDPTVVAGSVIENAAIITAMGPRQQSQEITSTNRGAIAVGDTVKVTVTPVNTQYQINGKPYYTTASGQKIEMNYQTGGYYTFTMPDEDIEISAVFDKVATVVTVSPTSYDIKVIQTRTGDRKNPNMDTSVYSADGSLLAKYTGRTFAEVEVDAIPNLTAQINDLGGLNASDNTVKWSSDNSLINILSNTDDNNGYTSLPCRFVVNMQDVFFNDVMAKLEATQAASNYANKIPDTVFGAGQAGEGGVTVVTAATNPASSYSGKPYMANSKINVTFKIIDNTTVSLEDVSLDKTAINYTVTRKLTGDRQNPTETITTTAPQSLTATFNPEFFDRTDVSWSLASDNEKDYVMLSSSASAYNTLSVAANMNSAWINSIILTDKGIKAADPFAKENGSGVKTAHVTVTGKDKNGNVKTATCVVNINYETIDETVIVNKQNIAFNITLTKTGTRSNPILTWTGCDTQILLKTIPTVNTLKWSTSDGSALYVDENGNTTPVTVDTNGQVTPQYMLDIMAKYPYTGTHQATVTATTKSGETVTSNVTIYFAYKDRTSSGSSGGGSSSSGGGGGGGSSSGVTPNGTKTAKTTSLPDYVINGGTWVQNAEGKWLYTNGRTYVNEWAAVSNPYADTLKGQSAFDWFRFDTNGFMVTGWYTDVKDGNIYFLHNISDNTLGRMYTGWHWIDGKCYYFTETSNGCRGALLRNTTTPDGYQVDGNGAWIVNGIIQTK